MISYCGDVGGLWMTVDEYLKDKYEIKGCIRFPYGNKYGWSMKYSCKTVLYAISLQRKVPLWY